MANNTIHILIVDDSGATRSGLKALLKAVADIQLIGEAVEGNWIKPTLRVTMQSGRFLRQPDSDDTKTTCLVRA